MKTFQRHWDFAFLRVLTLSILIAISITSLKSAPLSGTYTIGSGSGHNFSSFTQAIDTLSYYGVSGPVIFLADTGMYNEQIVIPVISGASVTNTITFKGYGDSTLIYYTPTTSNRPVVCFDKSSHVIFDSIRIEVNGNYGYGFQFFNGADSITIRNCYIELPNISSTYYCCGIANYSSKSGTGTSNVKNATIKNCTIEKGYVGIHLPGSVGSSSDNLIEGNTIFDFGLIGINASGNTYLDIISNHVYSSNSTANRAINMWPTGHSTRIISNICEVSSYSNHTRVIQVANAPGGGGSSWSQEILIANNFVRYYGTYTSNMTGIYTKHTSYMRVYNNTVKMATGTGAKSLWLDALSNTANIVVHNNNLTNYVSGGELLRVHTKITATLDYNNFYNSNSFKVNWKGANYTSLSSYQSNSSQDANSFVLDPKFVSSTDLHIHASNIAFDGIGTPLSQITNDIDGESRDASHPDIGADEYESCADLSITRLVNPTNCDYINSSVTISVWIKNSDTNAIKNIPVSYQINGGTVITETHTTSISGLDSVQHNFATKGNFGTDGVYIIKAFVASTADHNPYNDTLISTLTITSVISNLPDSTGACNGSTILLEPGYFTGATYLWSDASTDTILQVDTSVAAIGMSSYWVKILGTDGCIITDTVLVNFSAPANVNLGNDTSLCDNDTLLLNAANTGSSFLWQDNSTQSILNVTASGTYWVDVTTGIGCTVSDTILANFNSLPLFNLGSDTSICTGDSIVLDASVSNASYKWQNNSNQPTFKTFASGTYWVEVINSFGCSEIDTLVLSVENYPVVNLGNDTTICQGNSVFLNASSTGSTYLWQDSSTQASYNALIDATYWVEVSNSTGCMTKDSLILTVLSSPIFSLGNDTSICMGDSLVLDATTAGATYLWQNNSTNPTFTASSTGYFWAKLENANACIFTDSIYLTVNANPVANLGFDKTICDGEVTVLYTNSPGCTFRWQDNSTKTTFIADANGVYSVEVTNSFGCKNSDTVSVFITPLPVFNLGNDTTLCDGNPLLLDATVSGATYHWNNNTTKSTLSVSQTGDYWVEVSRNNCSKIDSIHITINPIPSFTIGNDTAICDGESVLLDVATMYCTYLWQDNSTQGIYNASVEGSYKVTVTNFYGCVVSDSMYLSVESLPLVDLGKDTAICEYENLVLDATTTNATYLWQDNSIAPTYIATVAGKYRVEVTNLAGCKAADSLNLILNPLPVFSLGNDTAICDGDILVLDVTTVGASYLWQDNSDQATFNASKQGDYWVNLTNSNGCKAIDSLYLTVNLLPQANLGADTSITIQSLTTQSFKLSAKNGYKDYLWSTASIADFIEIDTSFGLGQHLFWVRISDDNGCIGYDSITINIIHDIGLNEFEEFSCEIMPNPSRGEFRLTINEFQGELSIYIFNINGQLEYSENLMVSQNLFSKSFDLSALPKGIYNMAIMNSKGVKNIKIVIR